MTTGQSTVRILFLFSGLALTGCSGDRVTASSPSSSSGERAAAAPASPSVDMAGRWRLVAAAGGACGMTFTAPAGAAEGTIAPEGGCPGNFFTSRRWLFEQGSLVIRDHNGQTLTQLKQDPTGRFEGQTAKGELIWLAR
jgi:hypothetical protein